MANKKNSSKGGLADPSRLKPRSDDDEDIIRVVIETPKGSRNKYAFDSEEKVFELKKVLPAGWIFPTTSALFLPPRPMTATRSMCLS